jgi:hypothetical protein
MTVISKSLEVKPTVGRVAMRGVPATIIAVGINVVLFLIGSALGAFPEDVLTPLGTPIQLVAVAAMTLGGGIAATLGYFVLTRFLKMRMAKIALWIVGVIVLIVMFFSPLSLEGMPALGIFLLEVMHFMAGLLPIGRLTR